MTTIELYGTQVMPRVRELVGDDPIAAQPITKPSPAVQSREASEG